MDNTQSSQEAPTLRFERRYGLCIAVTSRALFDLEEAHTIYEKDGVSAFRSHLKERDARNETLRPGPGFALVQAMLSLNGAVTREVKRRAFPNTQPVAVIMVSRCDREAGRIVSRSIEKHHLDIECVQFLGRTHTGTSRNRMAFLKQMQKQAHCLLFLSADAQDVREAIQARLPAARILTGRAYPPATEHKIRLAFDGDAVLFDDESEKVFTLHGGLAAFHCHERWHQFRAMGSGPLFPLLRVLHELRRQIPGAHDRLSFALVTSRGQQAAMHRALVTFQQWGVDFDQALFLGGLDKGEFLKALQPLIFFDDQLKNMAAAAAHVPCGHVPYGIKNDSH